MAKRHRYAAPAGALLAFALAFAAAPVIATAGPGPAIKLVPHRAVYAIKLERAEHKSGVAALEGRMVYELTGNRCDGYTQTMRLVTRLTDREGRPSLSDIRSSSWEGAKGKRFRFRASTYRDRRLSEETSGNAERPPKGGVVTVRLKKPSPGTLELPGELVFPIQHSRAILAAAAANRHALRAATYDGSEQGRKFYDTMTFIGRAYPANADPALSPLKITGDGQLDQLVSWPVVVSYYDPTAGPGDGLPTYEMTFRFYANGVSRRLLMDYGDFAIRGRLESIEFLANSGCNEPQ